MKISDGSLCKGDHMCDWSFIIDDEGDPDVPNGVKEGNHWECIMCGEQDFVSPPPPSRKFR